MKSLHKKIFSTLMALLMTFTPVMATGSQGGGLNQVKNEKSFKQELISWTQSHKKTLGIGIAGLAMTGFKIAVTSALFVGIWDKTKYTVKEDPNLECHDIKVGDLSGKSYKLLNPNTRELQNKYVIFFGGNGCPVENFVPGVRSLLRKGATIVAVDYRGFGASELSISRFRISENTVYSDGENTYKYVKDFLHIDPSNIIVAGFSLGGSVASHVAAKASYNGDSLGGLILISPIDGVRNVVSRAAFRPLGSIAYVFAASSLDTEKNLEELSGYRKDIPLYLCSGGPNDFLGFGYTKMPQKARDFGFGNITESVTPSASHNDLISILDLKINDFAGLIKSK